MAPYSYRPFEDRFSGTIADIMARRGDIAARGAERVGDIQAQGIRNQGAIVGGAVQNIGQTIAAVPEQMRRAQIDDLALKDHQLEVAGRQRQADDLKALDAAYAQPGGREAVINALPGHLRPQVAAAFEASDKAHLESQRLRDEADLKATESVADMAAKVRDYGYDPMAAQLVVSDFKAKYANDPQRLAQIRQIEATLHENPSVETVKQLVDPLINLSAKRREEAAKADDLAQKTKNEDQIRVDTQARDAATAATQERLRTETERHNRELERISSLTAGRTEAAQKETERHDRAMEESARNRVVSRPLLSSDANKIADIDTSISQLNNLAGMKTGAGSQIAAEWVPNFVTEWTGLGADSKGRQALIETVKQIIGKGLEGGVLRKEDEVKYARILPRIGDAPAVAADKIKQLDVTLRTKREQTLQSLGDAGFNVTALQGRTPAKADVKADPMGIR